MMRRVSAIDAPIGKAHQALHLYTDSLFLGGAVCPALCINSFSRLLFFTTIRRAADRARYAPRQVLAGGSMLLALQRLVLVVAFGMTLLPAPILAAVFEPREFASAQQEARYKRINSELRCLVCQNQNIAGSDAPLAQDLRREVFRMLNEGSTDAQIVGYMVQRYGDFVLYRPPVNRLTIALWAGPFVLMVIGLVFLWRVMGRRRAATAVLQPLSEQERERLRKLAAE
jgi:cytochrome c-type biogenesis protein CcmH